MTTSVRWLAVASLAWVLWMDQTVYNISRDPQSRVVEGARSQFVQLAVVPTKAACEALRGARVRDAEPKDVAARRDAAADRRGFYPEQRRFFCSPAVDDSRR
jgi:hypothetical protein